MTTTINNNNNNHDHHCLYHYHHQQPVRGHSILSEPTDVLTCGNNTLFETSTDTLTFGPMYMYPQMHPQSICTFPHTSLLIAITLLLLPAHICKYSLPWTVSPLPLHSFNHLFIIMTLYMLILYHFIILFPVSPYLLLKPPS